MVRQFLGTVASSGPAVPTPCASDDDDMICILSTGRMMTEITPCSKALLKKLLITQLVTFVAFCGT